MEAAGGTLAHFHLLCLEPSPRLFNSVEDKGRRNVSEEEAKETCQLTVVSTLRYSIREGDLTKGHNKINE